MLAEFLFQRADERIKQINHQRAIVHLNGLAHAWVDNGQKHQRAVMVTLRALGNASADLAGLVWRVDERNGFPLEFRRLELGQQRVAQGFGGDAGAVGNKEG